LIASRHQRGPAKSGNTSVTSNKCTYTVGQKKIGM
jgi:hypothetical protein